MIHFECDYTEGAHPSVIEKLCSTNLEQTNGYGNDPYCEKARSVIRQLAEMPDADVHFLVGGTQTNRTVISSILRPHQGVIAASTGHIAVHETGAIEASGHKVLTIPSTDGKITASGIKDLVIDHYSDNDHEHCAQPGMVYISFPTETGTLYSKRELQELSSLCCELGLPLYIDGARLGYGLMADERPHPARNGKALRCVHHRRDERRGIVRRSCRFYKQHTQQGLPLSDKTERRHARQREAVRSAIPCPARKRNIFRHCKTCRPARGENKERPFGYGNKISLSMHHQSAICILANRAYPTIIGQILVLHSPLRQRRIPDSQDLHLLGDKRGYR